MTRQATKTGVDNGIRKGFTPVGLLVAIGMTWQGTKRGSTNGMRKGFTLVELLVVIGIIALLIAILMPALSRARKQALQVSCGSNERQMCYAAVAYGNDWKQQLPTKDGVSSGMVCGILLSDSPRLPIIGFDTQTIFLIPWDYNDRHPGGAVLGSPASGLGGWAYMLRDYLKNDKEVCTCPDGWFTTDELFERDNFFEYFRGPYVWLPHRVGQNQSAWSTGSPMVDRPKDVAKTASDKPDQLLFADYVWWVQHPSYDPFIGLSSNHVAGSAARWNWYDPPEGPEKFPQFDPNGWQLNDPDDMPLGSNRGRIDCRVTWEAFQNLEIHRYSDYCDGYDGDWSWWIW